MKRLIGVKREKRAVMDAKREEECALPSSEQAPVPVPGKQILVDATTDARAAERRARTAVPGRRSLVPVNHTTRSTPTRFARSPRLESVTPAARCCIWMRSSARSAPNCDQDRLAHIIHAISLLRQRPLVAFDPCFR